MYIFIKAIHKYNYTTTTANISLELLIQKCMDRLNGVDVQYKQLFCTSTHS